MLTSFLPRRLTGHGAVQWRAGGLSSPQQPTEESFGGVAPSEASPEGQKFLAAASVEGLTGRGPRAARLGRPVRSMRTQPRTAGHSPA